MGFLEEFERKERERKSRDYISQIQQDYADELEAVE